MKFLQVVPDSEYYVWQLYIQMLNFRKLGYEKHATILVGTGGGNQPGAAMLKFKEWTEAEVLFYPDTRTSNVYLSGLRPNILKQYFAEMEAQDREPSSYLYHDQDIIFTRAIDWASLEAGEECYVAEKAHNYISWDYLMAKDQVGKKYIPYTMFEIVGIDSEVVREQNNNTGGAQYFMKGLGSKFWEKVEKDCEALYVYMANVVKTGIRQYKPDEELPKHHIQIWTADMWAVLWNIWLFGKKTKWHKEINFSWPWEAKETQEAVMHNAGITGSNEFEPVKKGEENAPLKQRYFNKSRYNGVIMPFGDDFSFVSPKIAQHEYINLLNEVGEKCKLNKKNMNNEPRRLSIMGVFNTTNKIHPDLLKLSLSTIKKAVESTQNADVTIVTVSWEKIPNNITDREIITPFKGMGHLNYILQLKQALASFNADIVSILEHDVMYPPNYFDRVVEEWDGGKYGVTFDNYIGMNETGYQDVKERHQPFSLMSLAKFYLEKDLSIKLDECIKKISPPGSPFGWCYLEPNNKADLKRIPFSNVWPAIHVNMNHLGGWGSGSEGKNHHFTTHCEVCYEENSNGKTDRPDDWGNFDKYFTFSSKT